MQLRNPYRAVDWDTWKRREHFEVFGRRDYPYIGLTTSVEVTNLVAACRKGRHRFFNAFLYVVMRAMNSIENFRYRMFEDRVVLCDRIDPSFNVLDEENELFYFAYADYSPDFARFDADVEKAKKNALATRNLSGSRLDVAYISCLPWFDFSDIIQPMGMSSNDTVPRVIWGKFTEEERAISMSFSITGHHGLFDGLHIAKLLGAMADLAGDPSFLG